jgi:hypothetical protein
VSSGTKIELNAAKENTNTCLTEVGRATGPALTPGDKLTDSWQEGSDLKEYTFKNTGGTGKYEAASGGGTYTLEQLTDTLLGGKYKGTIELP